MPWLIFGITHSRQLIVVTFTSLIGNLLEMVVCTPLGSIILSLMILPKAPLSRLG